MVEEWRTIEGASRYEVSSLGHVRSWVRWGKPTLRASEPRLLKQAKDEQGRRVVNLTLDAGGQKVRRVHQLVAEAFLGPRPAGMVTCHNNGDLSDNRLLNLRYDTFLGNMHDKFKHGTSNTGVRNPMARLNEEQVREMRDAYVGRFVLTEGGSWRSNAPELAARFGVSPTHVVNVVRRTVWTHV